MEWYLNYTWWIIIFIILTVITWVLIGYNSISNSTISTVLMVISLLLMIISYGFVIAHCYDLFDLDVPELSTTEITNSQLLRLELLDHKTHIYQRCPGGIVHIIKDNTIDMAISKKIIPLNNLLVEKMSYDSINRYLIIKDATSKTTLIDLDDNFLVVVNPNAEKTKPVPLEEHHLVGDDLIDVRTDFNQTTGKVNNHDELLSSGISSEEFADNSQVGKLLIPEVIEVTA